MKKILSSIRSQSHQFRMTLAMVLALVLTGAIAALWIGTLNPLKNSNQEKAPSPFSALGATIKSTVKNADFKSAKPSTSSTKPQTTSEALQNISATQIIDAGEPDTMHDETNPYQN